MPRKICKITNTEYFNNIDRESKAYWFGYIFTKGSISVSNKTKLALRLYLRKSDENFLQEFCDLFEKYYKISDIKGTKDSVFVEICNQEFIHNLLNKNGILSFKTYTYQKLTEMIPKDLMHHFLRGYIEGYSYYGISKKSFRIIIMGTPELLTDIQEILKENIQDLNINKIQYIKNHRNHHIMYTGDIICKKILNYLYKDSTIFLDKKYKKIKDYYEIDFF